MHNQHAGLSQVLAEQHTTERHEQAAHARLARGVRPSRRRAPGMGGPSLVAASPLAGRRHRPAHQPPASQQLIDRRTTMSKLARTLILGAALAAMNLAGTTAIAQAHTNDDPASTRHRVPGQLRTRCPHAADDAAAAREHPGTPASPTTFGDRRPKPRWASPGATPGTFGRGRLSRAGSPAGWSSDLGYWPQPWRCQPCSPRRSSSGHVAGFGSARRPDPGLAPRRLRP